MSQLLSPHFSRREFERTSAPYANSMPPVALSNAIWGCSRILEPAREAIGAPIIINSGFRSPEVNHYFGGVRNSQHLSGCAADITCKDPAKFRSLFLFLSRFPLVDQLLGGKGWCHVSWRPLGSPRRMIRPNFYNY